MKFSAWFSIIVGLGMIGQWTVSILSGAVPEFQSEPIRIAFHLAAEGATAICLIFSGILLLTKSSRAKNISILSAGMLFYTAIVSPGYFAQLSQWPFVGMFGLIIVLNLLNFVGLTKI